MSRVHSDDCMIVTTGHCTCTVEIGQPVAQITRKRLVEEYQIGLTQGIEQGRQEGFLDGRREGFREGKEQGRAEAITEMTEAMERAQRAAGPPTAEMPDFIKNAESDLTREAWKTLHTGPVSVVGKPQSTWDEIIHGPEGAMTANQVMESLHTAEIPIKRINHIPAPWWWLTVAIAIGAGMVAWFGTTLLMWGYPFLWAVGTVVVTFCSIIIKLDIDARKRL